MALSKTTNNHDEIRKWAQKRGAVPSEVAGTHRKEEPGLLRFSFPRAPRRNDDNLTEIPWDEFFEKFDSSDLQLVYQEKTASGRQSNFNKLVHPEAKSRSTRKSSASGTRRRAA
jgi:hypothetical protein